MINFLYNCYFMFVIFWKLLYFDLFFNFFFYKYPLLYFYILILRLINIFLVFRLLIPIFSFFLLIHWTVFLILTRLLLWSNKGIQVFSWHHHENLLGVRSYLLRCPSFDFLLEFYPISTIFLYKVHKFLVLWAGPLSNIFLYLYLFLLCFI